jgi:hypothetical protein
MALRPIVLVFVLVLVGSTATTASAFASAQRPQTSKPCLLVVKGPAWATKGQKGTSYNILGVNGGSCATARTWFTRFTHEKSAVFKGPAGWSCIGVSASTHQGECTLKNGGIVEWGPKLKR